MTPDGAIRHDLGDMCVTATSTSPDHGPNAYPGKRGERKEFSGGWKAGSFDWWDAGDNTPEWILDLYRDYLWTGDVTRLKALWPTVRTCCAYMLAGDRDNNGLYDDPKTYDCFRSVPRTYISTTCSGRHSRPLRKSRRLWATRPPTTPTWPVPSKWPRRSRDCGTRKGSTRGPLAPGLPHLQRTLGEHSDDLLGLPSQLSRERVRQHLKYMFAHHYNGKTFVVSPGLTVLSR